MMYSGDTLHEVPVEFAAIFLNIVVSARDRDILSVRVTAAAHKKQEVRREQGKNRGCNRRRSWNW